MGEELLTVRQVAARLAVSPSFVYALLTGGRLKHHRLGGGQGGIRVSEQQLGEYLCGTERGGEPMPQRTPPKPIMLRHLEV